MKVLKISTDIKNLNDCDFLRETLNTHFNNLEKWNNIKFEGKELFNEQFNKEETIKDKLFFISKFGEISKLYKFDYQPFYNNEKEQFSYNLYLPKYERTIN